MTLLGSLTRSGEWAMPAHRAFTPDRKLLRFSREPVGDLLAGPGVGVVQVNQHRSQRQPLFTPFVRAAFRDLIETPEEALEMVRDQLPVRSRQVIDGVVDRAERARPALLVEIAAETLWSARRAGSNVLGQLALFSLELGYHACPPEEKTHNCSAVVD